MDTQLKEKNKALQEDIKNLCSNYELVVSELEEHILLKKKYEESQMRFNTVFEQSRFGNKIITSDLGIIQVNPALQVMLGYHSAELIGTKITDYSHPDFVNHWHELQENLWMKQIPSFQLDTCLVKKDGTTLWVSVTSILFQDNDQKLGYTTLEDISGRKSLEAQLQKHATMVNTDLENFVYTASHDLKSPLTNIEGLTTALQKKLSRKLLLDEDKLFSMIGSSVDRLKSTILNLTEIAKAQKEVAEEEWVSIHELLEEVSQDLSSLITDSKVIFHQHIEVDHLWISRKNLHCILLNLLSNAMKYRSSNRIPEVTIRATLQDKCILIRVQDNGLGIPENQLKHLFTMFKRFHTHVEGTGIGLYIIKRMIHTMHGRIEVESKLDTGTMVRVYLLAAPIRLSDTLVIS